LSLELTCAVNLKLVNCKVPSDTLNHDPVVLPFSRRLDFATMEACSFAVICVPFLTWAIVP
jgi:hypothetical protein